MMLETQKLKKNLVACQDTIRAVCDKRRITTNF